MKKITLLAILAIMVIGMLAFAACKAKTDEAVPTDTTAVVDDAATTVTPDSTVAPAEAAPVAAPAKVDDKVKK